MTGVKMLIKSLLARSKNFFDVPFNKILVMPVRPTIITDISIPATILITKDLLLGMYFRLEKNLSPSDTVFFALSLVLKKHAK